MAPKSDCSNNVISLLLYYSNLLGTHNPEWLGPENKILGIVLGWDPLYRLRLARVEEEKSGVRINRRRGELTRSSPILFGISRQDQARYEQATETDLVSLQNEWRLPLSGNPCAMPGYNPHCRQ